MWRYNRGGEIHIPDGFLSTPVWVGFNAVSVAILAAVSALKKDAISGVNIPLSGIIAAFVFIAQTLSFPLPVGSSGHFTGSLLAALLLGPYMGLIILSSVTIMQALILQDGGVIALGANIFNIAVIPSFGGYFIFRLLYKIFGAPLSAAAVAAVILSYIISTISISFQLSTGRDYTFMSIFYPVAAANLAVGAMEGVLTYLVVRFIRKIKPELWSIHS